MPMKDVIRICERLAPPGLATDGDNVGLVIGDPAARCSGVVTALDLTEGVVVAAVAARANLIVVHHPPIYYPLKRIDLSTPQGRLIAAVLRHGIAVYAMHTNLDFAPRGLNDYVARLVGLKNVRPTAGPGKAVYRIGSPGKGVTAAAFARQVKKALRISSARLYGDGGKVINKVAVCTGSGADLLADAQARGADLLLTGEVRHHNAMECAGRGMCMIDGGHLGTERPMAELVAAHIKKMMAKSGKRTRISSLYTEELFRDY
ncbi:MAG: Nif3-like dinuclear metal center hexameric protein [Candidatus Nitrosotenuis sp.]|nr:MAG: Nif3-like dinuclear metal center hexameric protein [Candidatus Nitrosotenuis sp.]